MVNVQVGNFLAGGGATPSPLQADDHYILRKLCIELLPWMIAGRRLGRRWFVMMSGFYAYVGDLAAALAGLGIGAPIAALATGKAESGQSALDTLRSTLPEGWFFVGLAALLAWIAIRLIVQKEDVTARALLARQCAQEMKGFHAQLFAALNSEDPRAQIKEIQRAVDDRVQNAIRSRVWDWDPLPEDAKFSAELSAIVARIRVTHMRQWAPSNLPEVRQ